MKRTIAFSIAALCVAYPALAQETVDTIEIQKAEKVVVRSDKQSMSVEIFGKENDPDYHFRRSIELTDGVNVSKESNSDFDFKLPFTKSSNQSRGYTEFTVAPTLSVGMVSALGGPSELETNFGKSLEITWHAFNFNLNLGSPHWSYTTGLWFNWKNYRMTKNLRFDLEDGNVVMMPYPEHSDYKFSRIHTLSYQIPLMVHYKTSHHFKFSAGALLNFNGHGNLKTKYSLDGKNYKDRDRGVHLNGFTADIIGVVSFRNYLGAYVKYSPFNVLDTNRGPKFHAISAGLVIDW